MYKIYRKVAKITLASYLFIQCFNLVLFTLPQNTYAAVPFTNAYATLSNSRFSYKAAIATGGIANNATYATIQSSGYSDNDTKNLFIGDTVCLNGSAADGCTNQTVYTVNNILSDTIFGFTPAISGTMNMNDFIVSTNSGQIAVTFKPTVAVAQNEKLIFTITAAASNYANGIPDSTGFDSGDLTANLVAQSAISSVGATSFNITSATLSSAASLHTVTVVLGAGGLSAGSTYTMSLGHASDATLRFLNPSPAGTTHTRGVSDSYAMTLKTTNTAGTVVYNQTQLKVNPVDGVFVSATVEQTLSFQIEPNTGTACGVAVGDRITTTATTVPFGSITSANFYDGAQKLTVSTNSTGGYTVTGYQDGVLTSGSNNIPNTPCDAAGCSSGSPAEWNSEPVTDTNDGFGFSLENNTNTPVPTGYLYNNGGLSFNAQPFPLNLFPTPGISIMNETAPASGSVANVCYRLGVKSTQPAGYYYNRITYVATPKF